MKHINLLSEVILLLFTRRGNYLTAKVLVFSCFVIWSVDASSQCTPRSLPFTETWSSTSFSTCGPTTGGWVAVTTGTHVGLAGGVGEEASNISCAPTECEGGTYPDLNFYGDQCYIETDVLRAVSPPINTLGVSAVTFSFVHYYASGGSSASINMSVLTSTDGVTWHPTNWSLHGGGTDVDGSGGVSFQIDNTNGDLNNANTYFAFNVSSGELCFLYGWWIDNVNIVAVITPTITSFTPSSGCAGTQTITIHGTDLAGATSVKVGGTPVSSITSNSDTLIVAVVGNGTTGPITVVTPNGTATSSTNFTVNTAPSTPGTISGPASVCNAGTYTYSVAPVNGATTYTWSLPGGWTGSSTVDSVVATEGTGGGTISVTAGNACGTSNPQTLAVTLAVAPSAPGPISGPDSVCPNSTNAFSVAAVGGATFYTWTLPSGWSGTSTSNSINATEGTGPGTLSVTAGNACGSSSAQTLTVTLASPPGALGSITGADSGCLGNVYGYSVTPLNGQITYNWTLPNGWSGTSTNASIQATFGATSGNVTVTASNACGSTSPQSIAVTVITPPAMPGAISGPGSVCASGSQTYSVAPVNGATSYTWTLPGSWTGSSSTDSIIAGVGASGGNISVTANGSCGSSSPQTLAVSILSAPATPGTISGPDSVCNGSTNTYSVATVSGATFYTWTLPNGWTGTSTTESISATQGTGVGTISVTAGNACGSSSAQTLNVSMGSAPAMPLPITQSSSVCTGGADTFSIPSVSGATSYTWTLPNSWTGSSSTEVIDAVAGSGGGTVSVTANNACGSSAAQTLAVNLSGAPAMPGSITGPASVCAGSNNAFSIATVGGATSYTWSLPNGWSGTSSTESINTTAGSTGGTVSVTANNSCGSSTAQTLAVSVVSAPATPGTITGPDSVCNGSANTFSVTNDVTATSYTWSLPNGWAGTSSTESIITTASGAGTISVTANNACGSSTAQTLAVNLSAVPAAPGAINGPDSVCSGSSATFSVAAVSGATSYTWTLPSGWSGTSVTQNITATAGTTGGAVSVSAGNSCGSSTALSTSVTVSSAPSVLFNFTKNPVCKNIDPIVALSGTPAGGTFSGTGVTGSSFDATALSNGSYVVTYSVSNAGCTGSDTATMVVTVCSGIDNTTQSQISVYPNPFSDAIIVNTNGDYANGTAVLLDATGREVRNLQFGSGVNNVQINTSSLANGAYLLEVTVEGKLVAVRKLFRME